MPHSALSRAAATMVIMVSLVGATLTAPSAVAADGGDRAPATQSRAEKAAVRALEAAKAALAGNGRDATMALRELRMRQDALPPAERAVAERLATRPTTTAYVESGNVRVHYNPGTFGPDYDQTDVLNTAVSVAQAYAAAGYRSPKPDFGKGGSNQIDIYAVDLEPGLYGYCDIDNDTVQPGPGRYDVPAFCAVDNDYAGFPTNTPVENLQVTMAHEYFHAVQFAYDYFEDGWFMEATAAWAEDELYDGIDDNVQYLAASPITVRKRSMDKFGDFFHNGVWIFFRYLTEKFPAEQGMLPKVMLQFWQAADSSKGAKKDKYSTQAISSVLKGKPYKLPMDKAFALFSDANLRARFFYDEGQANSYPNAKTNGGKALNKGQAKTFTAKLDHLSAASYRYTPKGNAKKLKISISGAPKVQGTRAVVTTYLLNGKVKTKYVSINGKGKGGFTAKFKKGEVAAVDVTLVNASTRFAKCYKKATPYSCSGKPVDQKKKIAVFGKAV